MLSLKRHSVAIAWVLASLALYYVMWGPTQYLYDDTAFVWKNPALHQLGSFSDVLSFRIQPARPVSNFFLALVHWWGSGKIVFQLILSLLLHTAVVLAAYQVVLRLGNGLRGFGREGATWVAVLFALHPLHSGVLSISLFRWEIMGTLGLLCAALCLQKLDSASFPLRSFRTFFLCVAFFLSIGISTQSKEMYSAFCALFGTLLVFDFRRRRLFCAALLGMTLLFWGSLQAYLLSLPNEFPYLPNLDYSFFSKQHLAYAGRSILEQIWKTVSGLGLTSVPLKVRPGPGEGFHWGVHALLLFALTASFFYALFRLRGWWRTWISFALAVTLSYAYPPNLDMGSEHYFYPATLALIALSVSSLRAHVPEGVFRLTCLSFLIFMAFQHAVQLTHLRSQRAYYLRQVQLSPGAVSSWRALAFAWGFHTQKDAILWEPKMKAKLYDPKTAHLAAIDFICSTREGDREEAERILVELLQLDLQATHLAKMHAIVALHQAEDKRCFEAHELFNRALQLSPEDSELRSAHARFERDWKSEALSCETPFPRVAG